MRGVSAPQPPAVVAKAPIARVRKAAALYARYALATAFLSGIASRFGLWGRDVGYGDFSTFMRYTAEVNSFMPSFTIPALAWSATVAELVLGVSLVVGIRVRWAAFASAALLLLFGMAMAVSSGVKDPLDYSVFTASAAALLLALDSSTSSPESIGNR